MLLSKVNYKYIELNRKLLFKVSMKVTLYSHPTNILNTDHACTVPDLLTLNMTGVHVKKNRQVLLNLK